MSSTCCSVEDKEDGLSKQMALKANFKAFGGSALASAPVVMCETSQDPSFSKKAEVVNEVATK